MKKLLFALTALAMIAVSCVSEIRETVQLQTGELSFSAATELPAPTRTVVAGETRVFWEPGDEVAVFAGNLSGRFRSEATEKSAETTFWGSLGDSSWPAGQDIWAVYPYRSDVGFDGSSVTTVLPSAQKGRDGSFGKDVNLSVAKAATPSMQFYNVGGGLRFTVASDGIKKVVMESLGGEFLSGRVRIGFQEGVPAVLDVEEGSASISLDAPTDDGFVPGTWYYIVAVPGTLEGGFRLSFYKDGSVAHKCFDSKVTIKRSVYGSVQTADSEVRYAPDSDENIRFADETVKSIVVRYFDTSGDGELSYREAAAVKSFLVAGTRAEEGGTSIFAGTGITTFDEIVYFTGLTKIEDGVFAGCTGLKAIVIPPTVTEIGANAFKGCTQLQYVLVQSSTPPTVGADAFSDTGECPIYVPAGTTDEYTSAWREYAGRIDPGSPVPDNEIWYTTTDGKAMAPGFSRMGYSDIGTFGASLISNEYSGGKGVLTFSGAVTKIGRYAFSSNRTLETVLYPKTVTIIRDNAFYSCTSLVSMAIPIQQTEIQSSTFSYCRSLSEIVIPDAVTTIRSGAFSYCSSLKRIEIPKVTSSIAVGSFNCCASLSEIVVNPENRAYDSRENCNAIIQTSTNTLIAGSNNTKIPSSVTVIVDQAFSGRNRLVEVEIPEGVTKVGSMTFGSCPSLTKIVFPASVSVLGQNVISDDPSLRTVVVASGNPVYDSRENCNAVIETATNTLFAGCAASSIPGSVTCIGENSFDYCSALTDISIPESVKSIGMNAFWHCPGLVEITIPGSVESVGYNAFSDCSSLIRVHLGEGIKVLSDNVFSRCVSLAEVTVPSSVTSIGGGAFRECSSLNRVTMLPPSPPQCTGSYLFYSTNDCPIYVPEESVDAYKGAQYWSEYADRIRALPGKKLYYTSSDGNIVTPSNPDAFGARIVSNEYVNGRGTLLFDGTLTQIGESAFSACTTLTGIQIPEGVTQIGRAAFSGCTGLTEIALPSMVVRIGSAAFSACRNLVNVELPADLTVLGEEAFSQCEKLLNCMLPAGLTEIGAGAFSECTSLSLIKIPMSVRRMGARAYYGCRSLTNITVLPKVPPTGGEEMFGEAGHCPILVLGGSEAAYKSAPFWSGYADRIQGMSGNEIYYTTVDESLVRPYTTAGFSGVLVSNEYVDGRGTLIFDAPIVAIPWAAFSNCSGLTSITLPDEVQDIGASAFYQCVSLTAINIPEGVKSIGSAAFRYCISLGEIILPESLQSIWMEAFASCHSLKSVRIPDRVTILDNGAFQDCSSLKVVTLPSSLLSIGRRAFYECGVLPGITIPAGVTNIGEEAFYDCIRMVEATLLPQTPPACGKDAFSQYAYSDFPAATYPIYVPAGSVDAYRTASGWSAYADRIHAMQ